MCQVFYGNKRFGGERMKTNSQQNERARTRKGDTISKEMSCPALKSKSNKRDGNSADRKLKELNDLREQNKQLRDLVELYNQGVSRIAMCSKCNIPFKTNQDRIRILLQKRTKGGCINSEKQFAVYHLKCFKNLQGEGDKK